MQAYHGSMHRPFLHVDQRGDAAEDAAEEGSDGGQQQGGTGRKQGGTGRKLLSRLVSVKCGVQR